MTENPEYGPAMSALNDRQQRFVLAMLTIPGCSHARAAREAGYSDAAEGAKVRGHYLAHNPAVQAAIREEAGKRLNSMSLIAANVLFDVMLDEDTDQKLKVKAALAVMDRTGFAAAQNINVTKTVTDQSGAAIMERIRALAAKHNLDPERLLAGDRPAKVIEGRVIDGG